jgi:hypothetical protein
MRSRFVLCAALVGAMFGWLTASGRDSIPAVDPTYKDNGSFEFTGKIEKVIFERIKK